MSYWGPIKTEPEVNRSEDLIRDAIDELEKRTHGKIKGVFSKVEFTKAGYTAVAKFLDDFFASHKFPLLPFSRAQDNETHKIELNDEELKGREDINFEHDLEVYKFEIFNDAYRFRIFQMVRSVAFPVRIVLDEGIAEELEMKNPGREIFTNDEMENFLREVLRTQKVRNVVNQLIVLAEVSNDENILAYLSEHPDSSVPEIAEGLKWSRSLTRERLSELEDKGKISASSSGKKAKLYRLVD